MNAKSNPNQKSVELLLEALKDKSHLVQPAKKTITLLLDTDREIGKEAETPEGRVGITPDQAGYLIRAFADLNISLTMECELIKCLISDCVNSSLSLRFIVPGIRFRREVRMM